MKRFFSSTTILAAIVVAAVTGWMLTGSGGVERPQSAASIADSGSIGRQQAREEPRDPTAALNAEGSLLRVSVIESHAVPVAREVVASARTEPDRQVELQSEVEGRVVALGVERGARIRQGETVARIDVRTLDARLAEAEALVEQHRIQFEAAQQLKNDNLMSEVQIAEARARLVAAQATLAAIRLDLANTDIKAPFDAIVQERRVEIGDFVQVGDTVADIVDTDPLIIVAEVSEREISGLEIGALGFAELVTGKLVNGTVRYISPTADQGTRTFRVELAVPNPDSRYRAGMTAELRLATDTLSGHLLSPALLTLDDTGTIGVKSVDKSNKVQFLPVEILRSTDEGIWVGGLPDQLQVIALGQGFVSAGEIVEPVSAVPR